MKALARSWQTGKQVLSGLSSYVPLLRRRFNQGTRGSDSARYCYSVWLRHRLMAEESGWTCPQPVVAELGPGDSIGIGLAAMLSGAKEYYALDIVDYATLRRNIAIFEELIELFRKRADIPDEKEFPLVKPTLADYSFPALSLSRMELGRCLAKDRLDKIRHSIIDPKWPGSLIHIIVPWHDPRVIPPGSVDLIFSQAVLEHVTDLELAYRAMNHWLAPGGFISHQIDFKCHWKASEWNGHWTYSDRTWRWIQGRQKYLLNREPHSTHIRLLQQEGFRVVRDQTQRRESNIRPQQLASRFRDMPPDDLTISGAFIQAAKRGPIPAR